MFTKEVLYQTLFHHTLPPSLWVAYSGGLDSHVLLHALAQLRIEHPEIKLQAIHVNHGLSPHAAAWSQHCQKVCDSLGVKLTIHNIDTETYGDNSSMEEAARNGRYQFFEQVLPEGECLVTAHHLDDQAETVLLRLLRGAGPQGLSAMAWKRTLGRGILARPFLATPRSDLEHYAKQHQLTWIEDESNQNIDIDRNYLRHQVLPLLTARWAKATSALFRAARHCREASQLLDEMAKEDATKVQGAIPDTLLLSALKQFTPSRQKNILRFWLKNLGFALPSTKKLQHLLQDCLAAKADATPLLTWRNTEIRCFDDHLYAMQPLSPHDATQVIDWDMKAPLTLNLDNAQYIFQHQFHAIEVTIIKAHQQPMQQTLSLPPITPHVTIRFRQGGESFHPKGRIGSHPLKKLFQEWGVAPWLRERIPLIYYEDELVMVAGFAIVGQ